jgi:hypothetical protein
MSYVEQRWFRQHGGNGSSPVNGLYLPSPLTIIFPPYIQRVTIERVRLGVTAFGFSAAEDFYWSPVNPGNPLTCVVAAARAETGSYPPPFNWPDIEDSAAHVESRPLIHEQLTPRYVTHIRNDDPLAGYQGVAWGASVSMAESDSAGRRTFRDTYMATVWMQVSDLGFNTDYPPGYHVHFNLDVLASSWL